VPKNYGLIDLVFFLKKFFSFTSSLIQEKYPNQKLFDTRISSTDIEMEIPSP
jgi:hypothetical protein